MNLKWLILFSVFFLPQLGFTAETSNAQKTAADIAAMGYTQDSSSQKSTAREIFGSKKGYIHPYLSIGEYFTDNLFNTPDNEKSEYTTVFSPGIWLALPASRQQLLEVDTLNTSPGGLEVSRFRVEREKRYQAYALYRADIEKQKNFPEEDKVKHRAEGLLQCNFRGGLSVEFMDIYEKDYDPYATGVSREMDEFDSNFFDTMITYRLSPKLRLRADYSLYTLSYDAKRNEFRERDDNAFSGYIFYTVLPKISAFVEYEFIDVDYDQNILNSSEEHHYFGGIQWKVSDKSRGRAKLGYGSKNFDDAGIDNREDFIAEAQLNHEFTPKTSAYLRLSRKTNETDIREAQDILTHSVRLGYTQKLTPKVSGSANAYYIRDSYRGDITVGAKTDERKDDYYDVGAALGYAFKKWLNLSAGYNYTERHSNFEEFDYQNNTLYLSITAAL
jgi:polysaccharide biosynthesis protein VpsM